MPLQRPRQSPCAHRAPLARYTRGGGVGGGDDCLRATCPEAPTWTPGLRTCRNPFRGGKPRVMRSDDLCDTVIRDSSPQTFWECD